MTKREKANVALMEQAYEYQTTIYPDFIPVTYEPTADHALSISCPRCNGLMSIKINKHTGAKFYGCINFPDCRKTINID